MIDPLVILLSLLQGITEFLPISSSGHLAVLNYWFGYQGDFILLEMVVHFGTLFSICFFYRKDFLSMMKTILNSFRHKRNFDTFIFLIKIFIAILPITIVGFTAKETLESFFYRPKLIAIFFLVTGVYLLLTKRIKKKEFLKEIYLKENLQKKNPLFSEVLFTHALLIGIAQMIAILPGISRSGMTITTALLLGFSSRQAMLFSFLIAIPIISGATFLEIWKVSKQEIITKEFLNFGIAFFVSFISGFFALKILKKFVIKNKFYYFSYYLFLIGLGILTYSFFD